MPLNPERTNVGAMVEQVVVDLRGPAEERGIEVFTQIPPRLPHIQADRGWLRRVFVNLVDNAIKHCPAGTTVRVRLCTEDAGLVAEVADNGPGIPEADLPRIFEEMYRVRREGTRATEGSGLGLSIVKRIVELHGGEITVESTVGEGTTFRVRLPADQAGYEGLD